jgi:glycosyltransferase involved in cell wall biosynthesis
VNFGSIPRSKKETIKLTFVTITLNNSSGLARTLESYEQLKWSLEENVFLELVVIDGGSTDSSLRIIKRNSSIIDYYVSEEDKGIYDAMNKGIEATTGDFVCFMNAGDCIVKDGMLSLISKIDDPTCCYAGKARWYSGSVYSFNTKKIYPRLLKLPNHQTMLIPAEFLKKNRFCINYGISADLEHKIMLYKEGLLRIFDDVVAECEAGGISHKCDRFSDIYRMAKVHKTIANDHLGAFWGVINFAKIIIWHSYKNLKITLKSAH